jgi:hypothetical protein
VHIKTVARLPRQNRSEHHSEFFAWQGVTFSSPSSVIAGVDALFIMQTGNFSFTVRAMSPDDFNPLQNPTGRKFFTIDEANATLPLVRAITADLVELSTHVIERRERLNLLTAGREVRGEDPYSQELAQVQREIEQDIERLQEYVEELRQIGVEPKNPAEGVVDFPAKLEGRVVFLCWQLGEPEVLHWHEVEAGFAGRQPIFAQVGSPGVYEDDDET